MNLCEPYIHNKSEKNCGNTSFHWFSQNTQQVINGKWCFHWKSLCCGARDLYHPVQLSVHHNLVILPLALICCEIALEKVSIMCGVFLEKHVTTFQDSFKDALSKPSRIQIGLDCYSLCIATYNKINRQAARIYLNICMITKYKNKKLYFDQFCKIKTFLKNAYLREYGIIRDKKTKNTQNAHLIR